FVPVSIPNPRRTFVVCQKPAYRADIHTAMQPIDVILLDLGTMRLIAHECVFAAVLDEDYLPHLDAFELLRESGADLIEIIVHELGLSSHLSSPSLLTAGSVAWVAFPPNSASMRAATTED